MAGNIYLFMAIIMMVLQSLDHEIPFGLRVRLFRPEPSAPSIPGIQPVLVRIQLAGQELRPDLYLGSQKVAWDDFETVLQAEINRRPPDWPVYVEGDPESDWMSVVDAIDRIRGLQAHVILLTRRNAGR
jgi:biopolymer transport protein ExbD